jgi:hypothetical protein
LGSQAINGAIMVKALPANTGSIYLGNDGAGDVDSSNGIVLAAGDVVVFAWVSNLSAIIVDSSADGEGVGWILLDV